jgi:hypothetical protein
MDPTLPAKNADKGGAPEREFFPPFPNRRGRMGHPDIWLLREFKIQAAERRATKKEEEKNVELTDY